MDCGFLTCAVGYLRSELSLVSTENFPIPPYCWYLHKAASSCLKMIINSLFLPSPVFSGALFKWIISGVTVSGTVLS